MGGRGPAKTIERFELKVMLFVAFPAALIESIAALRLPTGAGEVKESEAEVTVTLRAKRLFWARTNEVAKKRRGNVSLRFMIKFNILKK